MKIGLNESIQTLANVGVVLGMVFLAYELRQNTRAAEISAAESLATGFRELEFFIAGDAEFADILIRARAGSDLSPVEQFRVDVFYLSALRTWQNAYYQSEVSALDDRIWEAQAANNRAVWNGDAGLRAFWSANQSQFSPSFGAWVETLDQPSK